jgi:hypothetical protein
MLSMSLILMGILFLSTGCKATTDIAPQHKYPTVFRMVSRTAPGTDSWLYSIEVWENVVTHTCYATFSDSHGIAAAPIACTTQAER